MICEDHHGVVSWTELAVQGIRDGLTSLDHIETPLDRLRMLPLELDDLCEQIWPSIQQLPYAEAAQPAFIATVHREETLPVLFQIVNQNSQNCIAPIRIDLPDVTLRTQDTLGTRLLLATVKGCTKR